MRKSLVLISLIVVFVVVPSMVCAQALFGKKCKDDANKFFVTGAWVHSFNTHYSIDGAEQLTFAEQTGDWSYNYDAFQVGLGLPIALGDQGQFGSFIVSGTITLPSTYEGEELFTDGGAPPTTLEGRKWSADTYYATLEGLCAYPVYNSWSALGGFRWVYWQTSYKNPYDAVGTNSPNDTGDVTVNAYVPFFGIMSSMGGLTVGAVGFPTTLGTVEHKESFGGSTSRIKAKGDFNGGYFTEVFIDYSTPTFEMPGLSAGISVFCKASWLRATSNVKLENVGLNIWDNYDLILQRNLFFVGGKATFDFDLPSWPTSRIIYY